MSKHLRIWLFVILGTLLATTTLLAQGVITMTTSRAVGEEIGLSIKANGNVTIEGAQETSDYDTYTLTLTSQTVTIRGDVTELNCMTTQLTSLNVSGCGTLTELICDGNQLTSLDVSKNTALKKLDCSYNQLTSLDVSKNTALTSLWCFNNELTSLDVSGCIALTSLWCFNNQLTSLDVSKNTALEELNCSNNQLTNLNISGCARLNTLYCSSNCINGKAMTKLVNSLPNRRRKSSGIIDLVNRSSKKRDRNRCSTADVTTAKKKNWKAYIPPAKTVCLPTR